MKTSTPIPWKNYRLPVFMVCILLPAFALLFGTAALLR
jgi:hypothetical protein